jgi:acyl carrier protein
MIDKLKFLEVVKLIFEETPNEEILFETIFKNLQEWDSLLALSLIVTIEDNFSILITLNQIENSNTVEDLYLSIDSFYVN